jgi:hypothetical protein
MVSRNSKVQLKKLGVFLFGRNPKVRHGEAKWKPNIWTDIWQE